MEPTEPPDSASDDSAPDDRPGAAVPARASSASRSAGIGGIVAVVGGAAVVFGSLLEMVKIGIGTRQTTWATTTYFDTDNGKIVAALGVVALVVALVALVRPGQGILPAVAIAACGLAAFGLALSDRIDLASVGDDYRRKFFNNSQARGLVQVSVGPALYVVMAAGLVIALGAVLVSRDQ